MENKPRGFWSELFFDTTKSIGRAIVSIIACAIVGAIIGGLAGYFYSGNALAMLGAAAGAFVGVALWLVVFFAVAGL
ncbi:MAG: hypothetical protein KF864_15350 [Phycisphaeraceae bacterium]|nr:hypothetical protein [Phycisphaeraceae bacterium]